MIAFRPQPKHVSKLDSVNKEFNPPGFNVLGFQACHEQDEAAVHGPPKRPVH